MGEHNAFGGKAAYCRVLWGHSAFFGVYRRAKAPPFLMPCGEGVPEIGQRPGEEKSG